ELRYARAKDKSDKSLETYKFYINALYVALTRAVRNVYWIEADPKQRVLELLGLREAAATLALATQQSSLEEWQREAHKLELQGKQEQAERIRREILQQQVPNWEVYSGVSLHKLKQQALHHNDKKAKLTLFEVALANDDRCSLRVLADSGFKPALHPERGIKPLQQKHYVLYQSKNPTALRNQLNKYGVDFRNAFNQTPLMVAAWLGNASLVQELCERGADTELLNNSGFNAFQIALQQALFDAKYARQQLPAIYQQLAPDSLSLQIDGRLVKLDKHTAEFFLLNVMIALFYRVLPTQMLEHQGLFTAVLLTTFLKKLPPSVLPWYRQRRDYVSAILSKNEMYRQGKHNYKLFWRMRQGHYLFNPTLMLRLQGAWVNVYDYLQLGELVAYPLKSQVYRTQEHTDHVLRARIAEVQQHLQQVRSALLEDALAALRILCEQELRRIQSEILVKY
ncbi:MAG: ankyrin repeat domain-containing protein, partial [Thiothrix sp.]